MKNSVLFLITFLFTFLFGGCNKDDNLSNSNTTTTELEGTWVGKELSQPSSIWTFKIIGNKFDLNGRWGTEFSQTESSTGTVNLHPEATPKTINLNLEQCTDKQYIGQVALGIYKIVKDSLTMSCNAPGNTTRASQFVTGSSNRIWTLKKQ